MYNEYICNTITQAIEKSQSLFIIKNGFLKDAKQEQCDDL